MSQKILIRVETWEYSEHNIIERFIEGISYVFFYNLLAITLPRVMLTLLK